jgi:hypothetical protein
MSEPLLQLPPPSKGWLTWGRVLRAFEWLKARSVIDMPGAVMSPAGNGVVIWPPGGSVAPPAPFALRTAEVGGGTHALIQPGFVLAGADWLIPSNGTADIIEDNDLGATPDYVWLKLVIDAHIAPAKYMLGAVPHDTWLWSGVRLISADIIGDSSSTHANVRGTITETTSGSDFSAESTDAAEWWIKLAHWDAGTGRYVQDRSGNRAVVTGILFTGPGSTWRFEPSIL